MQYRIELLKGNSDTLLLFLLAQKPMYGYEIIKELEKRSKGYFKFKEGTLYPALHRLEKEGLLTGKWEQLPNGRERRYYKVTEKGLHSLQEKIVEWKGFSAAVNLVMQSINA